MPTSQPSGDDPFAITATAVELLALIGEDLDNALVKRYVRITHRGELALTNALARRLLVVARRAAS